MAASMTIADAAIENGPDAGSRDAERARLEQLVFGVREELNNHADWVEKQGTQCLQSNDLLPDERQFVVEHQQRFRKAIETVNAMLNSIPSPAGRVDLALVVREVIWSVHVLGRFSPPVEAIQRQESGNRAAHARAARQQSRVENPSERAVREAIVRVVGDLKIERTSKLAISILDLVNRDLADAGYKAVSVDKVRRLLNRLREFRALQEREKTT